jgi:hypothetical protein
MVFFKFQNFALHVHRDLAREIAVGHRRSHLGDVADLRRQVAGHGVDAESVKVLPHAAHALHLRLAAQFAFGADFARHARHFRAKAELS